ncbi:2'-deoxycytidine 5'-triphosphate deaminase [Candidatus Nomurabacteria bacterium]|nr:MAG: 2'-deoxycytidine 5'-triphosphate deaminase [Candidatus Nomurabacteria bacterium]
MKTKELRLIEDGHGALPYQTINAMKEAYFIRNSKVTPGPASLDLVLSEECYKIKRVIFPKPGESVYKLIKNEMGGVRHKGGTLIPGEKYLVLHEEMFNFPSQIYGYANPKSTTGRTFLHARLLADSVAQYDSIPHGWSGQHWNLLRPQVFPISYVPGKDSASQLRIMTSDTRLSELEIMSLQFKFHMLKNQYDEPVLDGGFLTGGGDHGYILFSVDCLGHDETDIIGYEAKKAKTEVPLGGISCLSWEKYFEPIKKAKYIELDPDKFYILSTPERISIPPGFAAEVKAIDERFGEFRTHYAGFFDPGFGYCFDDQTLGNTMTLEVRVYEKTCLYHGQPIVSLQFEQMADIPSQLYAQTSGTYAKQIGARLAKQFIL